MNNNLLMRTNKILNQVICCSIIYCIFLFLFHFKYSEIVNPVNKTVKLNKVFFRTLIVRISKTLVPVYIETKTTP